MPRTCSICRSDSRDDIDRLLVLLRSDSLREISRQFGVTPSALDRHRRNHMKPEVELAATKVSAERGGRLLTELGAGQERIGELYDNVRTILDRSLAEKDFRTALQGVRAARDLLAEAREHSKLIAEASGELGRPNGTTIQIAMIGSAPPSTVPVSPFLGEIVD